MIPENERKLIEAQIRNLESLIRHAQSDNPDIIRWKTEIQNLRHLLAN